MNEETISGEDQTQVSFIKKKVGTTNNYYFTPHQELTLWNAYVFDILPAKSSIVVSFKKDTNFLLYKLLQKKSRFLNQVVFGNTEEDGKVQELFTESANYFYIKVWIPPKQMFYLSKSKGQTLKEAIVHVNNIWENNTKHGFHIVMKVFTFKDDN